MTPQKETKRKAQDESEAPRAKRRKTSEAQAKQSDTPAVEKKEKVKKAGKKVKAEKYKKKAQESSDDEEQVSFEDFGSEEEFFKLSGDSDEMEEGEEVVGKYGGSKEIGVC